MNNLGPDDPLQIGRYRLLGRLGQGGMGTVYLGQDDTGRRVAVKVINAEYSRHQQFRVRFRREAEAAGRVRRFCTAAVLDADLDGEQLYVVTEYVDGPNLYDAVLASGPLRGSSLDALAVGVATALTAIHGAGIVHRDLKPSNVLLSPVGPRVIDFGIARALDTLDGVTGTGELMGTPRYMAPEVLRGAPAAPACDVFSWGGLVAFAASGRPAFGGDSMPSIMYQVLNGEPSLDGLEPPLRDLVAATLNKDPARRPTAQQILDQMIGRTTPEHAQHTVLQTWQAQPVSPPPAGSPTALPPTLAGPAPTIAGSPPTHPYTAQQTLAAPHNGPAGAGQGPMAGGHGVPAGQTQDAPGRWPGTPDGHLPGGPTGQAPGAPGIPRPGGPVGTQALGTSSAGGPGTGVRRGVPAAGRKWVVLGGLLGVVLVVAGVRALFAPPGPPDDLGYLYRADFNESGTGWSGGEYTGKEYGRYGYAPAGYYAIDVDEKQAEHMEKAPLPFIPAQPPTPDPSASPTPTTPDRLLITVTATARAAKGPGEYGLFCRADAQYPQSRYEFLLNADGEARIRRVTKGTGGDLTPPLAVDGLEAGKPAKVQAECASTGEGVRLALWVNGERVQSYVDNSGNPPYLPNGDVGFLARVPEKSGATLQTTFDDFIVQGPTPATPKQG
ncbi:serine/threonine protein kinase [Sphaerisporangium melleum]|uniref:serine/threonine protein kinase n=1 Tax=Sphaerisporangium melleum TaxID=321316 RepID=UPI001E659964|nr:serine/threonine-protein kinase [Sphaerisporangium melleum]